MTAINNTYLLQKHYVFYVITGNCCFFNVFMHVRIKFKKKTSTSTTKIITFKLGSFPSCYYLTK